MELIRQGRAGRPESDALNRVPRVPHRPRTTTRPRPRYLRRSWLAWFLLAMMVASDYKLRRRPPSATLSGSPDVSVFIELVVYGLVATFVFVQLSRPPSGKRSAPLLVAAWAFAITLALTATYAVYPRLALVRGVQLLIACGIGHAVALYARREHLHYLVEAFVVLAAGSVVLGLVYPTPSVGVEPNRFHWLYVHPVMTATYLGLAVVFLVGLLLRNPRRCPWPARANWIYIALLIVCTGGLLATRTRGAMAGCLVGCFVTAIASVKRRSRLDLLIMSAVVGVIAWMLASGEILSFLERGESEKSLKTLSARTELWTQAWRLFEQRPVFGYGLTASRGLFFDTTGLGGGHNALVNVMVDAGLFGIVAGGVLIVVLIRSARAVPRSTSAGADVPLILGAVAFLLVNSTTVEFLATPANVANLWLFVLVGWTMVLHRTAAEPGDQPERAASVARAPPRTARR